MVTDAIVHPQRIDGGWLPPVLGQGVLGASFAHSGMLAAADTILEDLQQHHVCGVEGGGRRIVGEDRNTNACMCVCVCVCVLYTMFCIANCF